MNIDWNYRPRIQSSFYEEALFYYVSKYFKDSKNRFKDYGFELDIYVPSIRTAFEFDGSFWHKKKIEIDNKKDDLCVEKGIKLIRIREGNLKKTKSARNYFLTEYSNNAYSILLMNIFNDELNIKAKFDVNKDSFEIL